MTSRERVFAALNYTKPDIIPVEYHLSPVGLYEHGERLKDLWRWYPQDFGEFSSLPISKPDPKDFDNNGSYHSFQKDEWGVVWECRIFGIRGHPFQRPLDDLANLKAFKAPPVPSTEGVEFENAMREAEIHRKKYFLKSGWISIFEVMHALRRMEDVLMDLASDTSEIHQIADIITDYQESMIYYLLARGVDAIQFGDDFGTQSALMLSLKLWHNFFKPRYERLMAPIRKGGVKIFFHSCGYTYVPELLNDLRELGVDAIWPQLTLYNMHDLAMRCQRLKFAVVIHLERSHLMTKGNPSDIKRVIKETVDIFKMQDGGSWFYVEIDNGFPCENVKALFEGIGEYRRKR